MEFLDGEPLDALHRARRPAAARRGAADPARRSRGRSTRRTPRASRTATSSPRTSSSARDPDGGVLSQAARLRHREAAGARGRRSSTRRAPASPIGTPYYMSPEQCRGRDVDHRTDIYAFGVLAYEMLTGEFPFDADDYMSILMQQLNDDAAAAVDALAPDAAGGVDDAVLWLLAKDPAERPPTCAPRCARSSKPRRQPGMDIGAGAWDVQSHAERQPSQTQPPRRTDCDRTARCRRNAAAAASTIAPTQRSRAPLRGAIAGAVVVVGVRRGVRARQAPCDTESPAPSRAARHRLPTPTPRPLPPPTSDAEPDAGPIPHDRDRHDHRRARRHRGARSAARRSARAGPGPARPRRRRRRADVPRRRLLAGVEVGRRPMRTAARHLAKKKARGAGKRPVDDIIDVFGGRNEDVGALSRSRVAPTSRRSIAVSAATGCSSPARTATRATPLRSLRGHLHDATRLPDDRLRVRRRWPVPRAGRWSRAPRAAGRSRPTTCVSPISITTASVTRSACPARRWSFVMAMRPASSARPTRSSRRPRPARRRSAISTATARSIWR